MIIELCLDMKALVNFYVTDVISLFINVCKKIVRNWLITSYCIVGSFTKVQIYLFQKHIPFQLARHYLLPVALCSLWGDGSRILRRVIFFLISMKTNTSYDFQKRIFKVKCWVKNIYAFYAEVVSTLLTRVLIPTSGTCYYFYLKFFIHIYLIICIFFLIFHEFILKFKLW
jgi:hypothetical protein